APDLSSTFGRAPGSRAAWAVVTVMAAVRNVRDRNRLTVLFMRSSGKAMRRPAADARWDAHLSFDRSAPTQWRCSHWPARCLARAPDGQILPPPRWPGRRGRDMSGAGAGAASANALDDAGAPK